MRIRKLSQQGQSGTPDQDADGIGEADVEKIAMPLPKANAGRPMVADVLATLCQQHASEQSIGIIAAGHIMLTLPV